ncbi:exodeoxyribonuclease III [Rhodococcus triatomae]|uniref:Exodeoxyribonuclease-3 n=1 Tax=Rhodococcus triatomae TaxID=300028 RepID=A0A1G8FJV7_9NOCA|nr:exodeoxyribonuclease III [Rhodococcus triatomae]QNG19505.1 exodeoxyribonuclease III [Rhodococcus triatomae]QNG24580.1 exodeoxyribonuclease III [Rhodococcus triatomae]SDH82453.1 exodeoxyribonuclease-3 [Rhodococcus triatomae]
MSHIISTVNVNGVRAAARKGLVEWLGATEADVVCLQETRASDEQLRDTLAPSLDGGWHVVSAEPAAKGRNGVAVLSREPADAVRIGHGDDEFAEAGRYLEADFGDLTVASLYLPSGEAQTPRQDEKERFMESFAAHLGDTAAEAAAADRDIVVCGDWNIAHTELDLKNWKTNRKNSGFLPHERDWLSALLAADAAWVDVVRSLRPHVDGPYSWWSYRGKAFDNDAGWRIDYQIATRALADRAKDARVERAATYDQRWSDHAPVTVHYR